MALLQIILASCAVALEARGPQSPAPQSPAPQVLPAVENVLDRARIKAEEFAQQAVIMQKRVEAKQKESADRLSNQRQVYANVLKGETLRIKMIAASNKRITLTIRDVQTRLEDEKKKAKERQIGNAKMRSSLETMEKKLVLAKDFLGSSLDTMDDRQQEILKVLLPPAPKPTLRHFLSVAASKFVHKVGLLQKSAEEHNPQDWLPMLTESLKTIEEAEREGELTLRNQFMGAWEKCNQTRYKLMQDQRELNATRRELDKMDRQMDLATSVLANSSTFLVERFGGIKFLADRLVADVDDVFAQADAILAGGDVNATNDTVANETQAAKAAPAAKTAPAASRKHAKQASKAPGKPPVVHVQAPKGSAAQVTRSTALQQQLRKVSAPIASSAAVAQDEDSKAGSWWSFSWR